MKILMAGLTVAVTFLGMSGAKAQTNNNLPFLRPQNGAQVPSGWPPGSGDVQARPPASYSAPYTAPGTYAPFQGSSRGNDRGIVGQPEPGTGQQQPTADTPDPLIGVPNRAYTKKQAPAPGDNNAGSAQQAEPGQAAPSQNNMGGSRSRAQEPEVIPKVIRLPKDPSERAEAVFDLFRKSREVKPPTQSDRQVAVGSRLPASWIYMDVPEIVTRALPGYVGYVYTDIDGRYVVTDPVTYKVIAIYANTPSRS